DEAELLHAALELFAAVLQRHAGRLRQRADADEAIRVQRAGAVNQVVADFGPVPADLRAAEEVPHRRRSRLEHHDVDAALVEQLDLSLLERTADLVVADVDHALGGPPHVGDLKGAEHAHARGNRRVVAVRIDDHLCTVPPCRTWRSRSRAGATTAPARSSTAACGRTASISPASTFPSRKHSSACCGTTSSTSRRCRSPRTSSRCSPTTRRSWRSPSSRRASSATRASTCTPGPVSPGRRTWPDAPSARPSTR